MPGSKNNDEVVLIKKYANRRLYNTQTSCYITLEDLFQMIQKGEDFVVKDAKSGEDLTRSVLTQIIFEQEAKGYNLLPENFLKNIIKLYKDNKVYEFLPNYLEMVMQNFLNNKDKMNNFAPEVWNDYNPMKFFENAAKQNIEFFENAFGFFDSKNSK